MKKKKQDNPPKPKEFSASPFSSLKGLKAEPEKTKPAPKAAPPARPVRREEPDDLALFIREMADVRRIDPEAPVSPAGKKPEKPAQPLIRKIEESERRLFLEALQGMDVTFEDSLPDDVVPLKAPAPSRMKRLRQGKIRIDLELDLHGLTREEALDALAMFVAGAYRRGQEAVLVITGKGLHSAAEPVLQGAVAAWLKGPKGATMVVEFAPAPRVMGGDGAYVVFLRRPPEEDAE